MRRIALAAAVLAAAVFTGGASARTHVYVPPAPTGPLCNSLLGNVGPYSFPSAGWSFYTFVLSHGGRYYIDLTADVEEGEPAIPDEDPWNDDDVSFWSGHGRTPVTVTKGACPVAPVLVNSWFLAYSPKWNDNTEAVLIGPATLAEEAAGAVVPVAAKGYTPVGNNVNSIVAPDGTSYGLAGHVPAGYVLVPNTYVGEDGTVFVGLFAGEQGLYPEAVKA